MDYAEAFGVVRDTKRDKPLPKRRAPQTPIAAFYREKSERITHWCKPCRRWHGPSCFHGITKEGA